MHESSALRAMLSLCPNLTYLAKVGEHASFATAAAELAVTPSTVSRAVRRMERELHAELVAPCGRGIVLTATGEQLASHARLSVEQMRHGVQEVFVAGNQAAIRVGLLESLGVSYVPQVTAGFAADHPDVQFTFREDAGKNLVRMLLDREIDAAVMAPTPTEQGVRATPLFEQRVGLIVAGESRLADRSHIDLDDLTEENFVLPHRGFHLRDVADRLFDAHAYRPRVILETNNLAMAAGLAAAGMGVAISPSIPPPSSGAVIVPLRDPEAGRIVTICTLDQPRLPPELDDFVSHVAAHPANAAETGRNSTV